MAMDVEKRAKVEEYINENEQTQGFGKLAETVADLTGLKEETESGQENGPEKGFLKKWLKNDESMLAYAELVMKTEKLSWGESIKQKLLEVRLSITCYYFSEFKAFLEELKRGPDTSKNGASTQSTELSSESSEISMHNFCGTNISSIRSEPFEKNSQTGVTWCSKTARNNGKNFGIILPSGDAYDAGKYPGKDSIQTIPAGKINERPETTRPGIEPSNFSSITRGNYADIYTTSKSAKYGHRAAAFKDDKGQWYVLDPYTRVNGRLDNSPKKLEDYLSVRKIVKAHIYESRGYIPEDQEV